MTAPARGTGGQDGVTVVEMAVVVALLGWCWPWPSQGLVCYQRAAGDADTRQRNLNEARAVMAVLTKDLRTATAFTAVARHRRHLHRPAQHRGTAPANQLRLYVDAGGVLREAVTPPDDPNASPLTYTGTR